MTTNAETRSREIAEATEAYTAGAWRFSWPVFVLTLGMSSWAGALTVITLMLIRAERAGAGVGVVPGLLVSGLIALQFGGAAVMLLLFRRWHARWRASHVEVEATPTARYPWLRGAAIMVALPIWLLVFGPAVKKASVPLQPLVWAGLAVLVVGLDMLVGLIRGATPAWRRCPAGLIAVGAYLVYAVAVALGAPQPWERVSGGIGLVLRIGVMQAAVAVLASVLGEAHARRELRRLQWLVRESSDGTD